MLLSRLSERARGLGKGRGRPEGLASLSGEGVSWLKANGVLDEGVDADWATADRIRCVEHLLLINDFRVQLAQMERIRPELTVRSLSSMSPLTPRSGDDQSIVRERIETAEGRDGRVRFTPDGVFSLSHAELRKTLLFFLEVNMGTETLVGGKRSTPDIRRKAANYQAYLRSKAYRRYEQIWDCSLRGFRLLFLAHSAARAGSLCRLVRGLPPPSDFIWVTDQDRLLSEGAWAGIWTRGGRLDRPRQSLLGSQAPSPNPAPSALS